MEARHALYCDLGDLPVIGGLIASLAFGWWWADSRDALAILPLLLREAREAWAATGVGMPADSLWDYLLDNLKKSR